LSVQIEHTKNAIGKYSKNDMKVIRVSGGGCNPFGVEKIDQRRKIFQKCQFGTK